MEGTKELKDVLDLTLGLVDAGKTAMKDGSLGVTDLPALVRVVPLVMPAVDGITKVPAELKDLTEAEVAELAAHVMGKLAVEDAKARLIVEKSLKAAFAGFELVQAIKS